MICTSKKKVFGTQGSATQYAQFYAQQARKYHKTSDRALYPYRCPLCSFWHLTSKPPKIQYGLSYAQYKREYAKEQDLAYRKAQSERDKKKHAKTVFYLRLRFLKGLKTLLNSTTPQHKDHMTTPDINALFAEQLELEARQARLQAQILEAQTTGKQNSITTIEDLIAKYKLSVNDVPTFVHELATKITSKRGSRGPNTKPYTLKKYLNPTTGEMWQGRGNKPDWLKYCEDPSVYLVKE